MTKDELIAKVAERFGNTPKKDIGIILDLINDEIMEAVASGDTVFMRGFGSYSLIERKAKTAMDFKRKKTIRCEARKIPKFKPYDGFLDRIGG